MLLYHVLILLVFLVLCSPLIHAELTLDVHDSAVDLDVIHLYLDLSFLLELILAADLIISGLLLDFILTCEAAVV